MSLSAEASSMKIMEIWIWVCGIDEDGTWHGQSLITMTQTQALLVIFAAWIQTHIHITMSGIS